MHAQFILSMLSSEKVFKEILHFYYQYDRNGHPCPWDMKFSILADPSLVIITMFLVCQIYAKEWRIRRFLKNASIIYFLPPNYCYVPLGWGAMKLTISCLLLLKMLIQNRIKIGTVVLETKTLTDDNGCLPMAIGLPNDSGDLKTFVLEKRWD